MISILTGYNPFQNLTEKENTPQFIIDRWLKETYKPSAAQIERQRQALLNYYKKDPTTVPKENQSPFPKSLQSNSFSHSSVSKHVKNSEIQNVTDSLEHFRTVIDKIHNSSKADTDSQYQGDLHRMIKHETGMKSKWGSDRVSRTHKIQHTHLFTNDGHKEEPTHLIHKATHKPGNEERTGDHVVHWRVHPDTGKVHIIGVSRHSDMKKSLTHFEKRKSVLESYKKP